MAILSWSANYIARKKRVLRLVYWGWFAQTAYTEMVFSFLSILATTYCFNQQTAYIEMNLCYV